MTSESASAFSNYRQLTILELQLVQLLIHLNPSESEPREVTEARRVVENALETVRHLNLDGIVPIIDAFAYLVLKARKKIK